MKPILFCIISLSFLFLSCSQANHDKSDLFNQTASLTAKDSLPINPFEWKVITFMINKKKKTMATLYGNDIAFDYASHHAEENYPKGSRFALVTWYQQADKHWFGANIPGTIKSVEFLKFEVTSSDSLKSIYKKYEGAPLRLNKSKNTEIATKRTTFILNQKQLVIPR